MTHADDLWIEMAQFDTGMADGLWEGSPPLGDAPAWYGDVATLIHAATTPANRSDLAGEAAIVTRMQAAVAESARAADEPRLARPPAHLAAAPPDSRRHHGGARLVGRIVAVKAAVLTTGVALGVTAAAATTGIVATVVVPALSSRDEPVEEQPVDPVDQGGGWSGGSVSGGVSDGGSPIDCVLRPETGCEGVAPGLIAPVAPTADEPVAGATPPGGVTTGATGEAVVGGAPTGDLTGTTLPPPAEVPVETTTTTTEPPTTTTTTEPPTTTTTEVPAGASESAAATTAQPLSAAPPGDGAGTVGTDPLQAMG